jgi:hypothetical protein
MSVTTMGSADPATRSPRHWPGPRAWWNLAAAGIVLRLLLAPHGGYPSDVASFRAWATLLARDGASAFYGSGFADYLPGYLYVLWLIGKVDAAVGLSETAWLVALKVPAILADVAGAWLVLASGLGAGHPRALPVAASYLFNPGVVFISAVWGQADAVAALLVLAGVAFLTQRDAPGTVVVGGATLLTLAVLVKPQTAPALLPAGLVVLRLAGVAGVPAMPGAVTRDTGASALRPGLLVAAVAVPLAVTALAAWPFDLTPLGLVGRLRAAAAVYPYGSVMAFNLWGAIVGFWTGDGVRWLGLPLVAWGALLTTGAAVLVAALTWRAGCSQVLPAAVAAVLVAAFAFPTRVHERYLLPALPVLAIAGYQDRRFHWAYAALSALLALNVVYAYTRPHLHTVLLPPWVETTVFAPPVVRALGLVAVGAAAWLLAVLAGHAATPRRRRTP